VDATGAANVADMPAAAPATSSVSRSVLLRWKNCRRVRGLKPVVDRALKVCAGFLEAANAGQ
jgi:hypothetical protein